LNIKNEIHLERRVPIIELVKQMQSLWYGITVHGPIIAFYGFVDLIVRWIYGLPLNCFSIVKPNLRVGGQYSKHGWLRLKKRGTTAVINMRSEYDDETQETPEHFLHIKVIDKMPPTLDQLQAGVEFIQKEIALGGQVYIHCAAGVGRAPTMAAAYLISTGLSAIDAWNTIKQVRPFIRPSPSQVRQIEVYAAQQAKAQ
jgi:hypothetical protein